MENSILFTGEPYDASGLYYLRARYYDPTTGRFITEDTLFGEMDNPLTQNLYAYCLNNPVLYIDPSGHKRRCDDKYNNQQELYATVCSGNFKVLEKELRINKELNLEKYSYISDPEFQVYCAWIDSKPEERIDLIKGKYTSSFWGDEFVLRLSYLNSKGIDVRKLSIEELDNIYIQEHEIKEGQLLFGGGAVFGMYGWKSGTQSPQNGIVNTLMM